MHRRHFLRKTVAGSAGLVLQTVPAASSQISGPTASFHRADWLRIMQRVAAPVLRAAAAGQLQQQMPVEAAPGHVEERRKVTYLEAVGRTLSGLAPWLEHATTGEEAELRKTYAEWGRAAIARGVDPASPAWLRFGEERQTIVDAAFLSLALARAPQTLCASLSTGTRKQLASALRATRHQLPPFNNWLLFAAMNEAALHQLGEDWDSERVDYALREIAAWYLGDGVYGDGPHFHDDYYNSFVIHPFLLAVLDALGAQQPAWRAMLQPALERAQRYAAIQERTIAPDGSYPPIGRSLAYRCGAFHLLADAAYRQMLPPQLSPEQVRCALSATIQRTLDAANTFDERGWLRIGLCGYQPSIGETYISTGSLYLCTAAFLPLGLSPTDRFWAAPDATWTAKKAWSGVDISTDHAIDD